MTSLDTIYEAFINGAGICTDTRNISRGCIFFALKGANFNGNTFAMQALENGASWSVVDEEINHHDNRLVLVDDVLHFLQQLALHHRKLLNIPFIAITGSNGKTTTKELVNRVLSEKYTTLCTKGNLNNHIGVPLTLLSVTPRHEIAVIEMGANHRKEIELLCSLALPTHVLVTNVGKAHLDGFGGFEGVKKGKGEMYEFAKKNNAIVFLNDNSIHLKEMLGSYSNVVRYGESEHCDIIGRIHEKGSYVSLDWKSKKEPVWHTLDTKITGAYNFENILSAVATGVHFNVDSASIQKAIESYIPDNQRSQEIIIENHHIILDAYNANPTSMEAALLNFDKTFKGKKAVMLGDMFELGSSSASEHQSIASLVKSLNFDLVVYVGPNFKVASGDHKAHYFTTSAEAAEWIRQQDLSGYNILIKGSRGSKMENVLAGLGESH